MAAPSKLTNTANLIFRKNRNWPNSSIYSRTATKEETKQSVAGSGVAKFPHLGAAKGYILHFVMSVW